MDRYPRPDYRKLARYLPDTSPVEVDLSDNRNLWGAHPAALEVVATAGSAAASEYPDPYGEALAEAVAERLGVSSDHICTGAGGTGVLDAVMRAVAPTSMRFVEPGWPAAAMLARMNGHEPVPVPWKAAIDDPDGFAGSDPAVVFVANPGNPTGRCLPDEWIALVQERTEAVGSVLIVDEAYGEYNREAGDETPYRLALSAERTLCVKTFSKAYGLAGMRAGYGVGSPALALEVDKARGPFAVTGVTSAAAAAAYRSTSPWLAKTVAETISNRDRMLERLAEGGHSAPPSAANFVFVLLAPEELAPVAQGLERRGVRVRPFAGLPEGTGLRATVGRWEQMEQLADALDEVTGGGEAATGGRCPN